MLTCWSSRLVVWADYGPFLGLLLSFGVPKQFPYLLNPKVRLRVGHQHSHFWPILARFLDYSSLFLGPGVISTIDEPRVRLRVLYQHSRFLSILARVVDNYSPFWGPEAISMVVKPHGALTCQSSTITL